MIENARTMRLGVAPSCTRFGCSLWLETPLMPEISGPPASHHEAIVQLAIDAIISIDEAHRIVLFNRGAEIIFGYQASEVLGQSLTMLLPEHAREVHESHVRRFATSGVGARLMSERDPVEGRRKNGELFPAEVAISHVRSGGRSIFTAMLRDISERRQAEAERRDLLAREREARTKAERISARAALLVRAGEALDRSLDYETTLASLSGFCVPALGVLCVIDLFADDGSVRRVAVSHDSDGSTRVADLLSKYPIDLTRGFLTRPALLEGRPTLQRHVTDEDLRRISQDEEHLQLWRSLAPTSYLCVPLAVSGRVFGALGLVAGPGRRRYDKEDLSLISQLAARAALAIDNARLYAQARRASALRDEALAMVTHDLRNPLATIQMATTRLEEEHDAAPDRRAQLLQITRQSLDWMHRMIQDLLDVASIDAGRLSVERVRTNVADALKSAGLQFESAFAQRGIRFLADVPDTLPLVEADEDRIRQLLANLLSNAAKFASQNGRVTLVARSQEGELTVSVSDDGPGIPPHQVPNVFTRFWHARRGAATRGTGLGLSIAKGIAEAHGGRIWVESREGEGSTFFFAIPVATIPVAVPTADMALTQPVAAPRAQGVRV